MTPPADSTHTQLDRIEQGIADIRDRLARMEVRQDSHDQELVVLRKLVDDHDRRLQAVEVRQAVTDNNADNRFRQIDARWAAIWGLVLVIVGGFVTYLAMTLGG